MLMTAWLGLPQNCAVLLPLSGHFHCYTTIIQVFPTDKQHHNQRYFTLPQIHLLFKEDHGVEQKQICIAVK